MSNADHVEDVLATFWPAGGGEVDRDQPGAVIALPSWRAPRCLLPAQPRLAARVLPHLFPHTSPPVRLLLRLAALVLSLPLVGVRVGRARGPRGAGIDTLLTELTGHGRWGMRVSRARANRKPVLLVVDVDGSAVAWVKVGTDELTARLVEHESEALARIPRDLAHVTVPEVAGTGRWHGAPVLALRPLPEPLPRAPREDEVDAAVADLATATGREVRALSDSQFWRDLGGRLAARGDARSTRLFAVWSQVSRVAPLTDVALGAGHGDWTPWNFAAGPESLIAWDFERYDTGVPVGHDVIHLVLQSEVLRPGADVVEEVRSSRPVLARRLPGLGVDAAHVDVLLAAYLLDIGGRWIADGQDAVEEWARVLDGMVDAAEIVGAEVGAGLSEGVR